MSRMLFAVIAIFLVCAGITVLSLNALGGAKVLPLENGALDLSPEGEWSYTCISSQYEIPDIKIQEFLDVQCWGGNEVPKGSTYITHLQPPSQCKKVILKADFISAENYDTRCFTRDEMNSYKFILRSGIIEMERK